MKKKDTKKEEIKRNRRLHNIVLPFIQKMNFCNIINNTPAEEIQLELQIRLNEHLRDNKTIPEFIKEFNYNSLITFLDIDKYQKDEYYLFFEELINK